MAFQIKLHHIRAFVEIARQGSIRGAARALNLSQPGVTKTVKELEEGLATQLLIRRSRGVILTENGNSFFQHACLILEELRVAQEDLQQRHGNSAGSINIGLGNSVARTMMPPIIRRFHVRYPDVKIRIMEGQLITLIHELRQGELDFTINTYYGGPYDNEFMFEPLFDKPYGIFARKGHPAEQATSLDDLLKYNWTMPTPRGSYFKQLQDLFRYSSRIPHVGVTCETFSSCISLVAQSDFLCILPQDLGLDPHADNGLTMINVNELLPRATYYLVQRRDVQQPPLVAALIQEFRKQSRSL